MNKRQHALALLERFERAEFIQPSEAESLLLGIVSMCRTYYRLSSALWLEDMSPQEILLAGTFGGTERIKAMRD